MPARPATEIQKAADQIDRLIASVQIELAAIRRLSQAQHGSTGKTDKSQAAENRGKQRTAK